MRAPPTPPDSSRPSAPAHRSATVRALRRDAWIDEPGTQAAAHLRAVLAGSPVVLFAVDREGVFTLSDGRGASALGWRPGEVVGRSAFDVLGEQEATDERGERTLVAEALRRGLAGQEFGGQSRVGDAVFDLALVPQRDQATGEVQGVVGVVTDVTRRIRAEEALHEAHERLLVADRLAGVGALAAGAAHEINNPLTYTIMNVEHVLRQLRAACAAGESLTLGDPDRDHMPDLAAALERAQEGLERVRSITRNLLTFSSGTLETRTPVDVRGVVEAAIQMAMYEIVHRARVERRFGDVPLVEANEGALGQVFLSLLVNAAQAIDEARPGDHRVCVTTLTNAEGEAVVEVRDSGAGIAPDVLPRIFDPFFSAKATGKRAGLGLSLSHRTVAALGGRIEVHSEPGEGSCFRVVLPRSRRWRAANARGRVS